MTPPANFIAALEHCGMFREYEHAFIELTGLPIALRAPDGCWKLSFRGKPRENRFCAQIAASSRACASCLQAQEALFRHAAPAPATITCKYGLQEIAVPVKIGDETIGFLQTGQLARRKPSPARFKAIADELKRLGVKFDEATLIATYLETPVVSKKRLDAIMHLLAIFADHLADKSNQITISQITSEPSIVVRGKHYIQEHLQEDLSLRRVSRAVNASTFHFCKVFKTVTGVHFTEFVSRVRVERAKELLLDHHLQISDIAYRVGFQSLTHFNRMFRRIAGESPTLFRNRAGRFPHSLTPESPSPKVDASDQKPDAVPPWAAAH